MKNVSIGLDIGSSSLKAVQMKVMPNGIFVENITEVKYAPGGDVQERENNIIIATKEILKKQKTAGEVITGVSGRFVIIRVVQMPFMEEHELKEAVRFEAEKYIPFDVNEVVIDVYKLGEFQDNEGNVKLEALLVAAKKDMINLRMELLKRVGIKTNIIDALAISLVNVFSYNYESDYADSTVAMIDLGHNSTVINVISNGMFKFPREISVGGHSITEGIANSFNVSYEEAEKMKMGCSLEAEEGNKAAEVVRKQVDQLIMEIQRSFDYYSTQTNGGKIDAIILNGGASLLKGIDKYFADNIGVPAIIGNPFKNLNIVESVKQKPEYSQKMPAFAVCTGLALRGVL